MSSENNNSQKALAFFEEISKIPRGSGNEKGIADYLESFACERKLSYYRDKLNNIVIYKCASPDRKNDAPIMLQGHMDMVCEANKGVKHDFEKDPIELVYDDKFLRANGTTLGADDGAAVAIMLAILDDSELSHPALECLFTSDEEVGMSGASGFDYSHISSKRCVNLDSETEGEAVVSCAGGQNIYIRHLLKKVKNTDKTFTVTVSGLCGGHSGADVKLGRRNANDVMFLLLSHLYSRNPFGIVSVNGGEKHNVITRESEAVITYPDYKTLRDDISDFLSEIRTTLSYDDGKMQIRAKKAEDAHEAVTFAQTHKIISCALLSPSGLLNMSNRIEGLADASSNLGAVKTCEDKIELTYLFRFNTAARLNEYAAHYEAASYLCGAELERGGYYPCWQGSDKGALIDLYRDLYKKQTGKEARVCAFHAGVECGFVSGAMGEQADIISIGPDIFDVHTTRERMSLDSFGRTYSLLCTILANC